jgi:Flp pilus assembly protein TadD
MPPSAPDPGASDAEQKAQRRRKGEKPSHGKSLIPAANDRNVFFISTFSTNSSSGHTMPVTLDDRLRLALGHHRAGRLGEAEAMYRKALSQEPDHPDALHLLGTLVQENNAEEALRLLQRAAKLDPRAPHFHCNLGALLGRMGRQEEAIASLREALRLKPDYPEAWNNLGVALEQSGRLAEAVQAHDRALALRSEYAQSHHRRGDCLRKLRRLNEAAAAYRRAVELKPDIADAYYGLAAVYGELGKQAEVIECHRRLGVILLPVPTNPACNPTVKKLFPGRGYACQYARLAIGVWQTRSDQFEAFDRYMFADADTPPLGLAIARAQELTGMRINPHQPDPEQDRVIQRAIEVYQSAELEQIPSLLFPQAKMSGEVKSLAEFQPILRQQVGL